MTHQFNSESRASAPSGGDPRERRVTRRARHCFKRAKPVTCHRPHDLGIAGGIYALYHLPLDALPDLSDVQVIVYTDWEGRSPDLVEDQITYPITTKFIAAPKVKFVRGESMFGKSFVYVIFQDGTDIYWARSRVIEYLNSVHEAVCRRA